MQILCRPVAAKPRMPAHNEFAVILGGEDAGGRATMVG